MELNEILDKSNTLSEVSLFLFKKNNYTNREKVKKLMLEEGIDWKEWLQIKKDEKKKYCLNCGKELKRGQHKFCSSSCAAKINNLGVVRYGKKKNKQCLNCGNKLKETQKKYCCSFCHKDFQYKEYIEGWKNGKKTGLKGAYNIFNYLRQYMVEKFNNKCQICGWGEINPFTNKIPLEIHHIDGNYLNNSEDNLQLLCPNCHSLTSTYKAANRNGRKERKKYR